MDAKGTAAGDYLADASSITKPLQEEQDVEEFLKHLKLEIEEALERLQRAKCKASA